MTDDEVRVARARHRSWRYIVVCAAIGLGLAACDAEPVARDTTTLRVLLADDWADTAVVADAVLAFERAHPGVRVDLRGVPFGAIPQTVEAADGAGEAYDVAHFHPFAEAANAQPLDDLWDQHLADVDYFPGAIEDVTWQGRRYGVPLDTNAAVMLVNRTKLAEIDVWPLPDPFTFADLAALAPRLTDGPDERALGIAGSNWTTYAWLRANGGEVVLDEDQPRFGFDQPEVITALDYLGGLIDAGWAFPPSARDVSTDMTALWFAGSTTFHVTGSWDIAAMERRNDEIDWEYAAIPMPVGPDATTPSTALGGSSLYVPEASGNRELAFAFMLHLTGDEYALRLAAEEGRLPARASAMDDPLFDTPAMRVVADQLRVARVLKLLAFTDVQEAFQDGFERIFVAGEDAAAVMTDVQSRADALVGP